MDPSRRFLLRPSLARLPIQRPPGAMEEGAFVQACTRCDACLSACPPGVIVRGDGGFPQMNFSQAGCDACGACIPVCEPGALRLPLQFEGWHIQIENRCLAQQGVDCRVCADACDVSAIRFTPRLASVPQPSVNSSACTGCGCCVGGCPTQAIVLARR